MHACPSRSPTGHTGGWRYDEDGLRDHVDLREWGAREDEDPPQTNDDAFDTWIANVELRYHDDYPKWPTEGLKEQFRDGTD